MTDQTEQTAQNEQQREPVRCHRCGSADWECVDDGTVDCWNEDDSYAGVRLYAKFRCKQCDNKWSDVSDKPTPDCWCEDW